MIFITRRYELKATPSQFLASCPFKGIRPVSRVSPIEDIAVPASADVATLQEDVPTVSPVGYHIARILATGARSSRMLPRS